MNVKKWMALRPRPCETIPQIWGTDMKWLIHGSMALLLIALVSVAIPLSGEIYRRHPAYVVCIWLTLPFFALWFGSRDIRSRLSLARLATLRHALLVVACVISFLVFSHSDEAKAWVRDAFEVEYVATTRMVETGTGLVPVPIKKVAHWYASVGLGAFEWLVLLGVAGIPAFVFVVLNKAEEKRRWEEPTK